MDDDDVTLISVDVGDEQEADGVPPYVQFVTYREAMVRGARCLATSPSHRSTPSARMARRDW